MLQYLMALCELHALEQYICNAIYPLNPLRQLLNHSPSTLTITTGHQTGTTCSHRIPSLHIVTTCSHHITHPVHSLETAATRQQRSPLSPPSCAPSPGGRTSVVGCHLASRGRKPRVASGGRGGGGGVERRGGGWASDGGGGDGGARKRDGTVQTEED